MAIVAPTQAVSAPALRISVVTGVTIGGLNPVTGLVTTDRVHAILQIDTAGAISSLMDSATLSAGGFTNTTSLSGKTALIIWDDVSA